MHVIDDSLHQLTWQAGFARLGATFVTHLQPTPLPTPQWVAHSADAAAAAGLPADFADSDWALQAFTGNALLAGSQPYASVYSGHQFGVWAGQLGDGRAIYLGETSAGMELQLKGAGRTPYSRGGDGRAVLRSSIREFLCSEAMHALDIPTTRAVCLTASDAPIYRETAETAAVVTRAAPSFIRFGHFEHFAARDMQQPLRDLADYVIDRYYPECRSGWQGQTSEGAAVQGNAYAALLHAVAQRTAHMVAHWQAVGFCHGVMNTDNMSILGLTIDYGPFQFLDAFDPTHICNHSDQRGRYAFNQQPQMAYWNLFCLGQALLPLIEDQDVTVAALESYRSAFSQAFEQRMCHKLGLAVPQADTRTATQSVIGSLLQLLAQQRIDHTIFWRRLSLSVQDGNTERTRELFIDTAAFDQWWRSYEQLASQLGTAPNAAHMLRTNPALVLRNHVGELAIRSAQQGDFSVVQALLAALQRPYEEPAAHPAWTDFPPDWASSIAISCSS